MSIGFEFDRYRMTELSDLPTESPIDLNHLRARLRAMSDRELLKFGRAALSACTPQANSDKPPSEVFVLQLDEARAEVKRRKGAKKNRDFGL
jgi:hypothetical protein